MPSSHAYKINHRRRYPKGEGGGVKGDECHSSKSSSSINYSFQCYPRVYVIILIRLNFSQEFWAPNDPFACIRNWSKKKSKVILRKRVSIDKNLSVISFSFKKFFQKNEQDEHDEEKVWQQCSLLHVFNCNKIIKFKKIKSHMRAKGKYVVWTFSLENVKKDLGARESTKETVEGLLKLTNTCVSF